jgi:hypothetical protein
VNHCIHKQIQNNFLILKAFYYVSYIGMKKRFHLGLIELIPLMIFYIANFLVITTLFKNINGQETPLINLILFVLNMIVVDSIGDAFIFKGISEYLNTLREKGTSTYFCLPGSFIFKVIFLRFDFPMVILGTINLIVILFILLFKYSIHIFILYLLYTIFGILCHMVLTSGFFIIQAYFIPNTPISYGNPASRLYVKPLQLIINNANALFILTAIYPAYFITAASNSLIMNKDRLFIHNLGIYTLFGILSILIWIIILNFIIKKSILKY